MGIRNTDSIYSQTRAYSHDPRNGILVLPFLSPLVYEYVLPC